MLYKIAFDFLGTLKLKAYTLICIALTIYTVICIYHGLTKKKKKKKSSEFCLQLFFTPFSPPWQHTKKNKHQQY